MAPHRTGAACALVALARIPPALAHEGSADFPSEIRFAAPRVRVEVLDRDDRPLLPSTGVPGGARRRAPAAGVVRALVVVVALVLAVPASAGAHATLTSTEPARGATLPAAPEQVSFRFSEPVETTFGAVRVFDSAAERVDEGAVRSLPGNAIGIGLRDGLPEGSYTATYRVISADGHPVSGGVVFSVGTARGPARSIDELLGEGDAGPVTSAAFTVAKATVYGATAIVVGLLAFLLWCTPRGTSAPRLLRAAAATGFVGGALGLVLQGATVTGGTFWSALDPSTLGDVLQTRFGTWWGIRELAWLALLAGPLRLPAVAVLLVAPALSGHAATSTEAPRAVLLGLDAVHVAAMSVWVGGLVALMVLRAETRAIRRFSTLALVSVATLAATGTLQAVFHLHAFDDLLDTAFGRAVLIKSALLAVLIGLGAIQRRRALPAGDDALLRRTVRAELALLAAVLVATGALVGEPPPSAPVPGPVSERVTAGPVSIDVTVDPAQAGPNAAHLYLFAPNGAPFTAADEVRATATLPARAIGPLPVTLRPAGPGHFVAVGLQIAPPGDWVLELAVRIGEFDEHRTRIDLPIH